MTIQVRRLREHETALLRDVRLRALREAPDAFATTFAEASAQPPEYWAEMAREEDDRVTIVAVDGERGVGLISGWLLDSGSAWLARVWVDPGARGAGVGLRLIEAVADWARKRGAATLELSVTANNDAAAALYARAGVQRDRAAPAAAGRPRQDGGLPQSSSMKSSWASISTTSICAFCSLPA